VAGPGTLAGGYVYVTGERGLEILDHADPARLSEVGAYHPEKGTLGALAVSGDYAFVAGGARAGQSGLRAIRVADPSRPVEAGVYSALGRADTVTVAGTYAYVTEPNGLHVADLRRPGGLAEVGAAESSLPRRAAVHGSYAYIPPSAGPGGGGLRIVDVSNPTAPAEVAAYALPGAVGDVAAAGQYLYVATSEGLRILDVSDPVRPVEVGRHAGPATSLAVAGTYAYLVHGAGGLRIVDVSDAADPVDAGTSDAVRTANSIAVSGSHAYVTAYGGLYVFDVSDPRRPSLSSFHDTPRPTAQAQSVAVAGSHAYVSTQGAGLRVIDVSNPLLPNEAGFFEPPGERSTVFGITGQTRGVTAAGGDVYVAATSSGLWKLRFTGAREEGPATGAAAPAVARDARYSPQTGYRIDHDPFWAYFGARGGADTLGYPISRTFRFLGCTTQFLQRQLLQQCGAGPVQTMNLLDPELMPYSRINGSTFPAHDPEVAQRAPAPGTPGYAGAVLGHVRRAAPEMFEGQPVRFLSTFLRTAPAGGGGGVAAERAALLSLEVWGFPTSAPAFDPQNGGFVYQRFQRGIMHFDANTGVTRGILLGDWFKAVITGRALPPDLLRQAAGSRFFRQYCPASRQSLCRPDELPGTDLTFAFEPQ
jgi:hypothetical protein